MTYFELGQNNYICVILSISYFWVGTDIVYYLNNLSCCPHLVDHNIRAFRLKFVDFFLTQNGFGWRNIDGIILRCVDKEKDKNLIEGSI